MRHKLFHDTGPRKGQEHAGTPNTKRKYKTVRHERKRTPTPNAGTPEKRKEKSRNSTRTGNRYRQSRRKIPFERLCVSLRVWRRFL